MAARITFYGNYGNFTVNSWIIAIMFWTFYHVNKRQMRVCEHFRFLWLFLTVLRKYKKMTYTNVLTRMFPAGIWLSTRHTNFTSRQSPTTRIILSVVCVFIRPLYVHTHINIEIIKKKKTGIAGNLCQFCAVYNVRFVRRSIYNIYYLI